MGFKQKNKSRIVNPVKAKLSYLTRHISVFSEQSFTSAILNIERHFKRDGSITEGQLKYVNFLGQTAKDRLERMA